MITICLSKDQNQKLLGFTVSGHAGYEEKGTDIVCAAVTTAAMTAVNGLTDVANISLEPEVREGYLACTLPKNLTKAQRHDADLLLESMVLSMQNFAQQYGDYIKICEG